MKRICFVTTISGTIKSFLLDLTKYLVDEEEYDVTFICDNDNSLFQHTNDRIHYIPVSMKRGIAFDGIKVIWQLYRIFKRENFDIVTSRAVSNLSILSEISLPFVKQNGYFIPLKGSNLNEIEETKYAITILGGKIEKIINFKLPVEESERNILLIKKVNETPSEYPRQYSKIVKNSLKKEVK